MMRATLLTGLMVLLAACAGEDREATAPPAAAEVPAAPQKTVLDAQLKTLDRTKQARQQLEDANAKLDRTLDDTGR